MPIPALREDYRTLDLGDARRDKRALLIIDRMQDAPDASLPHLFGNPSELEAAYRLLNNDAVNYWALLEPHADAAWARAAVDGSTLILHDTTGFEFRGDTMRAGLAQVGSEQGFFAHFSLAVPEGERAVAHGVVSMHPYVIEDGGWWWTAEGEVFDELLVGSQRWSWAVQQVRKAAPSGLRCVHVMDREGDDYVMFNRIAEIGDDFVIRSLHDRTDGKGRSMTMAAGEVCFVLTREVHLSRRSEYNRRPKARSINPDRIARLTQLSCRAAPLEIKRPRQVGPVGTETMRVNVVEVIELAPPEGVEGVYWRLMTTLPVGTPEEIARVVDIYRKRWLIEEYFKAVKTGCQYEKRQGTSMHALLNVLALTIPTAWRLLLLRSLAQSSPEVPAAEVVNDLELEVLRQRVPAKMLPKKPSAVQVMLAVARLGGHLPSNGAPGWLILGRGWESLMKEAHGWRRALRWAGAQSPILKEGPAEQEK